MKRKEGGSLDEAVIIYDKKLLKIYKSSVLSVTKDETEYKVTVGLKMILNK